MPGKGGSGDGYAGPERRRTQRRVETERRQDIRWEPGKKIRRGDKGRRAADKVWDRTRER